MINAYAWLRTCTRTRWIRRASGTAIRESDGQLQLDPIMAAFDGQSCRQLRCTVWQLQQLQLYMSQLASHDQTDSAAMHGPSLSQWWSWSWQTDSLRCDVLPLRIIITTWTINTKGGEHSCGSGVSVAPDTPTEWKIGMNWLQSGSQFEHAVLGATR